ncbi:MAG: cyclomaltodextrinase [Lachnospiraceae bacterium]|nr:cyclomaltodextrinase [Lachnospiraceae bacterium]
MWAYESVFYQIYPLGFLNAPRENFGEAKDALNIKCICDWIPHFKKLGINAIYFSPLFESDTHGYNTRDYRLIDKRLGTNEDFKLLSEKLHENGIRVVLDGVFNHVGRGFFGFKDVQERKWDSPYKDWFARIDFNGNSNYNDGFWYEGWEGNYDLVKLNLYNPEVRQYLLDSVTYWIKEFGIDGLRLDVAYCLSDEFMYLLRDHARSLKEDFFLVGEAIHGDYNRFLNNDMLNSVTNYECYKGLYSSFNSMNMFEIVHSLLRQFGPENWTLYKGRHLMCFADNHDVSRIASTLNNQCHLKPLYGLLFTMPGIPCIYYGSEWGAKGNKSEGDWSLRPCFKEPEWNELTDFIVALAEIKKYSHALNYGDFKSKHLANNSCVFERRSDKECITVAINASDSYVNCYVGIGQGTELIANESTQELDRADIEPYSVKIWRTTV